jgi:hypothetical protein
MKVIFKMGYNMGKENIVIEMGIGYMEFGSMAN